MTKQMGSRIASLRRTCRDTVDPEQVFKVTYGVAGEGVICPCLYLIRELYTGCLSGSVGLV